MLKNSEDGNFVLRVFTTHTQIKEVECLEEKEVSKTANTSWTKKSRNCQDMGLWTPTAEGGCMALGGTVANAALRSYLWRRCGLRAPPVPEAPTPDPWRCSPP